MTLAGGTAKPQASALRLTVGTGWQDGTYGFDGRGNMTSKEVVSASGTVSEARTFNDLNQITQSVVGSTTWIYTWTDEFGKNSGNLLQNRKSDNSEILDYYWNDDNRLIRVVKTVSSVVTLDVSYTYDSIGRMLTRKLSTEANPTRFEWDGWDLVREVDPAGVETVYYAPQGEITSFKRGTGVYQVHADAIGSVRKVSDSSGAGVASTDYDAWGNAIASSGASFGRLPARFVGTFNVREDLDTALHYMRQRWYDPGTGMFISRDPVGTMSGPNLYEYGQSSPVNYIDPLGLAAVDCDCPSSDVESIVNDILRNTIAGSSSRAQQMLTDIESSSTFRWNLKVQYGGSGASTRVSGTTGWRSLGTVSVTEATTTINIPSYWAELPRDQFMTLLTSSLATEFFHAHSMGFGPRYPALMYVTDRSDPNFWEQEYQGAYFALGALNNSKHCQSYLIDVLTEDKGKFPMGLGPAASTKISRFNQGLSWDIYRRNLPGGEQQIRSIFDESYKQFLIRR